MWWSLQPPTADRLYDRIMSKTADGSIDSIREAEDDIREFLNVYSNDRRAAGLRKYQTEIELDRMQREFDSPLKRLASKKNLQPIERAYVEAMNYVRLDPEIGMAKLQAIVDLYEQPGRDAGPTEQERCLILAKRRLDQLREEMKKRVTEQLELLQDRLNAADALRQTDPRAGQGDVSGRGGTLRREALGGRGRPPRPPGPAIGSRPQAVARIFSTEFIDCQMDNVQ